MCPRNSIIISSVYDWGKIPFSFDQLEAQHVINTFYGMIATNKNQSASSKDAGHFRGSNYHKLGCLWRFQDYSRTESGTEGKNEKESDLHSIFLSIFGLVVPCPGKPRNHRNFDSSPYSKMPSSKQQKKSSFLPPWNDQVFGSRFRVHWDWNQKTKVFEVGSKYFTSIFCTLDAWLRWNENPAYPWILHRFIKLLNALPWLFPSSIN